MIPALLAGLRGAIGLGARALPAAKAGWSALPQTAKTVATVAGAKALMGSDNDGNSSAAPMTADMQNTALSRSAEFNVGRG